MTLVEYKVPGGKMVAAETFVEGGRLAKVKITGDFFMHPEDALEELEDALTGLQVDGGDLDDAVSGFFEGRSIEIIGASPGDFVHVIRLSLAGSTS